MRTKATQTRESAGIADLSVYRARKHKLPPTSSKNSTRERAAFARNALLGELNSRDVPIVAYAAVLLSEDGEVTISGAGIEPQFAPAIQSGLRRITRHIEKSSSKRPSHSGQAGFAKLLPLLSTAILAATYINVIPWIDVALSVLAQLVAGVAARTKSSAHSIKSNKPDFHI
ncbi:hypothetical protein [Burkholderia gladioli]|uniref:hypothetical protein n=1 Tax=Burkholderia gladioli TaxID=28095 RepID=UPI00163E24F5|nr:hypothetical protein [Burkholderia gladioli]